MHLEEKKEINNKSEMTVNIKLNSHATYCSDLCKRAA